MYVWEYVCGDKQSEARVALCNNTHLRLHAFGSASTGASVRRLGMLPLSLLLQLVLLQLVLLGVRALCASCTVHRLDWLLNTLRKSFVC